MKLPEAVAWTRTTANFTPPPTLMTVLDNAPREITNLLARSSVPEKPRNTDRERELSIVERGITLAMLVFITQAYDLWNWATWEVVEHFVKPYTACSKCRMVEVPELQPFVGVADSFVSHAWGGKWGDLVSAVAHRSPLDRRLLVDVFFVLQHSDSVHSSLQQTADLDALEGAIQGVSQGTILVWNPRDANPIRRCWCLYECHITALAHNPLVVKFGHMLANKNFEVEDDATTLWKEHNAISLENAGATVEEDKTRILAEVKAGTGFWKLHLQVSSALKSGFRARSLPAVEATIYGINLSTLTKAMLNMKGDHGQTALMQFARTGYIDGVKRLLEAGADTTVKDDHQWTALMIAQKYCNSEVVDLLLPYLSQSTSVTAWIQRGIQVALAPVRRGLLHANAVPRSK
ncbi:hypothetical protein CYMTET_46041 [Cymbomonas tetramitiformis]|uniref:Uncharacterized protein n=1 Tax=Cymbomonas tetramitiformis TaxID=36881 RepID=A0AAE0EXF8_9CHLO|nr:hypothetical protein CYMTET_46041 [Cymbomonas tetramitiformis]